MEKLKLKNSIKNKVGFISHFIFLFLNNYRKTISSSSKMDKARIYIIYTNKKEGREIEMALEDRKLSNSVNVIQNLVLENREKLSISGVLDVLSFDDQVVIVETELGLLTVKGENLRINKLSIDTSEVVVEGEIYNLSYSENDLDKKSGGFLNKIFK